MSSDVSTNKSRRTRYLSCQEEHQKPPLRVYPPDGWVRIAAPLNINDEKCAFIRHLQIILDQKTPSKL